MANDIMSWERQMEEEAREVAESAQGGGSGTFFSLKGGVLSYDGQAVPGNAIKTVVLAAVYGTQYYIKPYTPDSAEAPDCIAFADSFEVVAKTGPVPEENAESKQAESCIECPHFQWGSGKFGRGKACKMFCRLALVPADALSSQEEVETAEIALLKVPTTSVSNYNEYVKALADNIGRPPWGVVTLISVVPDAKTQFKVHFKPVLKLQAGVGAALAEKRARYLQTDGLRFVGVSQDSESSGTIG